MEIENLTKDIRQRAFERKEPKTPDLETVEDVQCAATFQTVHLNLLILTLF